MELKDILEFQVEKRIVSVGKLALEEIEALKKYCSILEKIMQNAGFEDKEYLKCEEIYQKSRKRILDCWNENNREIQDLMKKFDIKLK